MTVALQREWASVQPFGASDQKTDFTPERVAGRLMADELMVSIDVSDVRLT